MIKRFMNIMSVLLFLCLVMPVLTTFMGRRNGVMTIETWSKINLYIQVIAVAISVYQLSKGNDKYRLLHVINLGLILIFYALAFFFSAVSLDINPH